MARSHSTFNTVSPASSSLPPSCKQHNPTDSSLCPSAQSRQKTEKTFFAPRNPSRWNRRTVPRKVPGPETPAKCLPELCHGRTGQRSAPLLPLVTRDLVSPGMIVTDRLSSLIACATAPPVLYSGTAITAMIRISTQTDGQAESQEVWMKRAAKCAC